MSMTIWTATTSTSDELAASVFLSEAEAWAHIVDILKDDENADGLATLLAKSDYEGIAELLSEYLDGSGNGGNVESHELTLPPVIVTVNGGVADVQDNPHNLPVRVLDLDNLNADLDQIEADHENGQPTDVDDLNNLIAEERAFIAEYDEDIWKRLQPFLPLALKPCAGSETGQHVFHENLCQFCEAEEI